MYYSQKKTFNLLKNINQKGGDGTALLIYLIVLTIIGLGGYSFYQYKSNYVYGSNGKFIYRYNTLLTKKYGKWIQISESLDTMPSIPSKVLYSTQIIDDIIYATNGNVILSHGLHSGIKPGNWEPITASTTIKNFQVLDKTIYICDGSFIYSTSLNGGVSEPWKKITSGSVINFQVIGSIIYACNGNNMYKFTIGDDIKTPWTQITGGKITSFQIVEDIIYGCNGVNIFSHGLTSGIKDGKWQQLTGGNIVITQFKIFNNYMYALIGGLIYRHSLDANLNVNNWIQIANDSVKMNSLSMGINHKILGIKIERKI